MSSSIPMIPVGKPVARLVAIVVILAARPLLGAPGDGAPPPVFRCDFDAAWDANYDGWPDGWTRAAGPGYPKYVTIEVIPASQDEASCLSVALDGGGAIAYSPLANASREFSYQVEVEGQAEGLSRNQVWASLTFYDAERRPLETHDSPRLSGTTAWKPLAVGPIAAQHPQARYLAVGLHVEPQGRPDVQGGARFRAVRVRRLPRLEVESAHATHVYDAPRELEFRCRVSGYASSSAVLRFALTDGEGRALYDRTEPLPAVEPNWLALATAAPVASSWRPRLPDYGFYRAAITLEDRGRVVAERILPLAVVAPQSESHPNEFGWSLADEGPLDAPELADLIAQGGIGWFKLPLWLDEHDPRLNERIALVDRAANRGVRAVGVLGEPPDSVPADPRGFRGAAAVFATDPEQWYPPLEATLARLGLRVRHWQLGADGDPSFVGDPQLVDKLRDLRKRFDQLGQGAGLGLSWNWLYPTPVAAEPAFVSLTAVPELTPDELRAYLSANPQPGPPCWVLVKALPRTRHSAEERAADLVTQMVAAKAGRAAGIFFHDPFDPEHGLLGPQGEPDDLFVPWRTTALMLGGAKHLGRLDLPSGSRQEAFARDDRAVLVLWADTPRVETLRYGEELRVVDLWGRPRVVARSAEGLQVSVGREPCFVTGLAREAVSWQLATQLQPERLPSRLGGAQPLRLSLVNDFPQGVTGRVRVVPPETWRIAPDRQEFKAAAGQKLDLPLELSLPFDASGGQQWVRLDFELSAGRPLAFSVYRPIVVGDEDVELTATTRINAHGELEVEQRLVNRSPNPLSFRCDLFLRGRKRVGSSILEREQGEDIQTYRIGEGRELIGQTLLLRAEEIDGPRVLNTRVVVER